MRRTILLSLFIAFLFSSMTIAGDIFPEWRGVNGQGHADAVDLPVEFTESDAAWKHKVPGLGWSTPVVVDGKVWVTTGIDVEASEDRKVAVKKTTTSSQPLIISSHVSLRVQCLDLGTGKVLKDIEMLSEENPQFIHQVNSYATPTPIVDGDKLYCHYGPMGIACLDMRTDKVLWSNRTLRVKHENGPGSSPILWNDRLIIHCDGIDLQYIVAIDKNTGEILWKTQRSGKLRDEPQLRKAYATSIIVEVEGKDQIVSPAADWIFGYDPETGEELWKTSYGVLGFSNAGRPVAAHGMVYINTGYMKSELLALKIEEQDGKFAGKIQWRFDRQVPNVSSMVIVGDEMYFASDNGIATCLDAKTGEVNWVHRMGSRYWASPLFADGKIYFFERDSKITVVEPGKEYKELAENQLSGTLFASPSAVDGHLLIRTDEALYCIKK